MAVGEQVYWLLIIATAVASIAWTVTQEEIFREPREYCGERSKRSSSFVVRKFFYIPTCEYCFSHWVTLVLLFITGFQLIFNDWRGYLLAFFVTAWMSNQIMSLYRRLRVVIKLDNVLAEKEKDEAKRDQEIIRTDSKKKTDAH